MKTSGRVNFSYDGYGTVTRLKNKTLKGMFDEAQRNSINGKDCGYFYRCSCMLGYSTG